MNSFSPNLREKDEVLICSQDGVALYSENTKTKWEDCFLFLSSHFLYYYANKGKEILAQSLEGIFDADNAPIAEKGFLFRSDKIIVHLPSCRYIKFSFRKGGMETFFNQLISMLEKRLWRPSSTSISSVAVPQRKERATSASNLLAGSACSVGAGTLGAMGIAGIMEDSKEKRKMSATIVEINDVMEKASILVETIRQMKLSASSGIGPSVDSTAIESIEATLGMGTVVQKGSQDRSQFYEALAIELQSWMIHEKNKHIFSRVHLVPLTELYALYNKARRGSLVSPDDLLGACKALNKASIEAKYQLTTLSSGMKALLCNDDSILLNQLLPVLGPRYTGPREEKIFSQCRKDSEASSRCTPRHTIPTTESIPRAEQLKSINDAKAASLFQVSIPVARDLLMHLEARGFLCHADGGFGLCVFYWNIFVL